MALIEVDATTRAELGPDGWVIETDLRGDALTAALRNLVHEVAQRRGARAQLWIEGAGPADDEAARSAGFAPYRDLLQMRCRLPTEATNLSVRPFEPADAEAFLRVNNRAFDWHPEQGGMTLDDLAERQAESWYDPAGFLLLDIDGELAGFCWTKIHHDEHPPLGEIYAIAVDPGHHGKGLGRPLTLAGLSWLHEQGLNHGILYVESDNTPAVRVYERIGFSVHQVNRAYERFVEPTGP